MIHIILDSRLVQGCVISVSGERESLSETWYVKEATWYIVELYSFTNISCPIDGGVMFQQRRLYGSTKFYTRQGGLTCKTIVRQRHERVDHQRTLAASSTVSASVSERTQLHPRIDKTI